MAVVAVTKFECVAYVIIVSIAVLPDPVCVLCSRFPFYNITFIVSVHDDCVNERIYGYDSRRGTLHVSTASHYHRHNNNNNDSECASTRDHIKKIQYSHFD